MSDKLYFVINGIDKKYLPKNYRLLYTLTWGKNTDGKDVKSYTIYREIKDDTDLAIQTKIVKQMSKYHRGKYSILDLNGIKDIIKAAEEVVINNPLFYQTITICEKNYNKLFR